MSLVVAWMEDLDQVDPPVPRRLFSGQKKGEKREPGYLCLVGFPDSPCGYCAGGWIPEALRVCAGGGTVYAPVGAGVV